MEGTTKAKGEGGGDSTVKPFLKEQQMENARRNN